MKMRVAFVAIALFAVSALSVRAGEDAPKKKYKVLYLSQSRGFEHGSVHRKGPGILAPSEVALTQIGETSGLFETECTQDASIITADKLKGVDVLMFYTTGDFDAKGGKGLPITEENFTAITDWLKSGKGFVGTHSATDTLKNFKPYTEMINGSFAGHPWGSGTKVTITNHDPEHPTVKMWGTEFQFTDEIYQYGNYDPKAVRVLLSLNMEKCGPKMPYMVPVCWVRDYGQGRLFYTNLGHNEGTWTNPKFQEHLLAGIRFVLKLENGSTTPNPDVQAEINAHSALATFADSKPWLTEAATQNEAKPDEVIAAAEKLAKSDLGAFKKLINDINGIKGEKDAAKKKERTAKLISTLK